MALPLFAVGGRVPPRTANRQFDGAAWVTKTAAPIEVRETQGAVFEGKFYICGRFPPDISAIRYDIGGDSWETLATMGTGRADPAVAALAGFIYVVGGLLPVSEIATASAERFDVSLGSWSPIASIDAGAAPFERAAAQAVAFNGRVYVFGGFHGGTQSNGRDTILIYDPNTDSWSLGAPMPAARSFHTATLLGNKIYVVGGQFPAFSWHNTLFAYTPATDSWETLTPAPAAFAKHGAGSDGSLLHIYTGEVTGGVSSTQHISYNPATDSWSVLPNFPISTFNVVSGSVPDAPPPPPAAVRAAARYHRVGLRHVST